MVPAHPHLHPHLGAQAAEAVSSRCGAALDPLRPRLSRAAQAEGLSFLRRRLRVEEGEGVRPGREGRAEEGEAEGARLSAQAAQLAQLAEEEGEALPPALRAAHDSVRRRLGEEAAEEARSGAGEAPEKRVRAEEAAEAQLRGARLLLLRVRRTLRRSSG